MNNPDADKHMTNQPTVSVKAAFLVGFMGAGKSTVGAMLARRLHWRFIDLDDRIVARAGRAIPDIFSSEGEAGFRHIESDALKEVIEELQSGGPAIVALGGGAYAQEANVAAIASTAIPVIFLDAPVEELRSRCAPHGSTRPLFQDESRFRRLYEERRAHYRKANVHVDTSRKPVDVITEEILDLLAAKKRGSSE